MSVTSRVAAEVTARLKVEKPGEICPEAPDELANAMTDLGGNVVYVVLGLFAIATVISIGLILIGKSSNSQMLTRCGVGGLVGVVVLAVVWVTVPGIADTIIDTGCIGG